MKFYLKLDNENIIRDAITYPHAGYTEVEINMTQLPAGINAGYYRWTGTMFEIDETLKPKNTEQEIEYIKKRQDLMQDALDNLLMGGM